MRIVYVANDGTEFDSEALCLRHENYEFYEAKGTAFQIPKGTRDLLLIELARVHGSPFDLDLYPHWELDPLTLEQYEMRWDKQVLELSAYKGFAQLKTPGKTHTFAPETQWPLFWTGVFISSILWILAACIAVSQ